jgi:hypothetical protein
MEVDLEKLPSSTGDPDKLAKMKFVPGYALPVQFLNLANDTALLSVQIRWFFNWNNSLTSRYAFRGLQTSEP